MMKIFTGFLVGGIIGFVGGLGVMLTAFPFLFPPPMVNEKVSNATYEVVAESRFRQNVIGHDVIHWGRGDIAIYRKPDRNYVIEFKANFEVGAGPNFWIYINSKSDINDELDFENDTARIRITKIKSFQGSQVYEVSQADMEAGAAITIWCESFNEYIASANYRV
ncbi:MAG: DM13 domain-containing protein [Betaproteobacteria bacterium]|nr:DM13 domain-containing protein [Betaproteobacteria bacterium]